ncbi:UbiD family decarboxylase [Candidatus Sumerlaeota bacterium]|nr:UbiD family decarboxylase [Candidatus Sumerlaeota bacterium]
MIYSNLRETIDGLEKRGELLRVKQPISTQYEITALLDRLVKSNGPAVLFENVEGHTMPVLGNIYGTRARTAHLLGVEKLDDLTARLEDFLSILDTGGPKSFLDKLKMLPKLKELADMMPAFVSKAPCQEVVWEKPDLTKLPVLRHWPLDGGPFITFGLTFTRNPVNQVLNCGLYRHQIYSPATLGMHWQKHKGGADHARLARDKTINDWAKAAQTPEPTGVAGERSASAKPHELAGKERLPAAIAIGCDPIATFCGAMPAPPDINEMMIAGAIRGKPIEMVECQTIPGLHVPAEAEIVLEGYVDPFETSLEGPFGDHTGYYSPQEPFPVFHVERITTRRDPVYLTTIVGKPIMEDAWLGEAILKFTLPIMKKQFPEIVDVDLPPWGVFHNLMIIAIRKSFPGQARKVMHGIWGLGQAMFTKTIIVVDHDVDVHDYRDVCFRACASIDPIRDFEIVKGPLDQLDHAGMHSCYGGKVGIDATTKWPDEGLNRPWPPIIEQDRAAIAKIASLWRELKLD